MEMLLPVGWRRERFAGRMFAEVVVSFAFFRVLQRRIRFGDVLEFRFAFRVGRDIGMIFVRELAVGLLDIRECRGCWVSSAWIHQSVASLDECRSMRRRTGSG